MQVVEQIDGDQSSARYVKWRNRTSPVPAAYNAGLRLRKP